jgi:hypothetical protein
MKTWLLVAVLSVSSAVSAADRVFSIYGVHDLSCGKYVQDVNNNPQAKSAYGWWVAGFISGLNVARERFTTTDNQAHDLWLLKYCNEHPLEPFITAAAGLDSALTKK